MEAEQLKLLEKEDENAQETGSSHRSGESSDALARAEAAEKELAAVREKARKAKEAKERKAKERAEAEALEKGRYEEVLAKKEEELKAAQKRLDALNEAADKRINAAIEKLSEKARKEIEIVRDALSREKLEELVSLKLGLQEDMSVSAPPAPGPTMGRKHREEDRVPKEVREMLDELYASDSTHAMAELIRSYDTDGGKKYRFLGTGDDDKDTHTFIKLMRKIGVDPWRDAREKQAARVKELGSL